MDYQTLSFQVEDGYALITLNRPEKKNSLNAQMRAEITYAVRDVAMNGASMGARAIVFTGAGSCFCAGQELGNTGNAATVNLERVLRDEYMPMIKAIVECDLPTMAAVHGSVSGAGMNLALACDVVVASEDAVFCEAMPRIGLMPDAGGTYFLPREVGSAKAMGMALFAEKIPAKQAEAWGMIWEALPQDSFEAGWKARASHLGNGPSAAYKAIKQAHQASGNNTLTAQLELEAKLQGACGKTRDFQEGVVALQEKRKPQFEGR